MGANSSLLTREIGFLMSNILDRDVSYRFELISSLRHYSLDSSVSPTDALQWTAERLIKDFLDPQRFGAIFVPALNSLTPQGADRLVVNDSIARAAMGLLQELKVDLDVHRRLLEFARDGNLSKLKKIHKFADIQWIGDDGSSALLLACEGGHFDAARYLLFDCSASCSPVNRLGWSSLMWAAYWGWTELVKSMTAKGAKIELFNSAGETPLILAAQNGHFAIVRHLIDLNADVKFLTQNGDNALALSVANGHSSIVKALVEAGAVLDQLNKFGQSAIFLAAQRRSFEIVEFLVAAGARIDITDYQQKSICDFEENGRIAAAIQRGFAVRIDRIRFEADNLSISPQRQMKSRKFQSKPAIKRRSGANANENNNSISSSSDSSPSSSYSNYSDSNPRRPLAQSGSHRVQRRRPRKIRRNFLAEPAEDRKENFSMKNSDAEDEILLEETEREMKLISQRSEEAEEKSTEIGGGKIVSGEDSEDETTENEENLKIQIRPWKSKINENLINKSRNSGEFQRKISNSNSKSRSKSESAPGSESDNEAATDESKFLPVENSFDSASVRSPLSLASPHTPINPFALSLSIKPSESKEIEKSEILNDKISINEIKMENESENENNSNNSNSLVSSISPPSSINLSSSPPILTVSSWLTSRGFDSSIISLLSEFNFSDLKSLDRDDAVELLGESLGEKLFTEINSLKSMKLKMKEKSENGKIQTNWPNDLTPQSELP